MDSLLVAEHKRNGENEKGKNKDKEKKFRMHQLAFFMPHDEQALFSIFFFTAPFCNKLTPLYRVVVAACTKITGVTVQTPTASSAIFCHLVSLFSLTARSISYYPSRAVFTASIQPLSVNTPSLRVLINYHNKSINNHITTNIFFVL